MKKVQPAPSDHHVYYFVVEEPDTRFQDFDLLAKEDRDDTPKETNTDCH